MFAALTIGGEIKKFYRFQTADDGIVDYYDETGKSAKKFLVRKPVADGIMRSGFGARNHPLLGYYKMHTGVDWAAPLGTPIYASGNGTIEKVGWESGYGKYVRIKHANGYETAYGHMTAFARSTQPGARVRQGQVIGYVGSTGLSTGPHVHYEILVNGRFVDPMRVKLPRGRVLEGPLLAGFDKERDRVDSIIAIEPARRAAPAGTLSAATAPSAARTPVKLDAAQPLGPSCTDDAVDLAGMRPDPVDIDRRTCCSRRVRQMSTCRCRVVRDGSRTTADCDSISAKQRRDHPLVIEAAKRWHAIVDPCATDERSRGCLLPTVRR